MFIEKLFIFLLFLAPLIFFHELGHYLLAKLAKVKVETFSIGFGPKLLKFYKWGTEFTISLIPLGGYVKMFGDSPENYKDIPHDQRHQAYQYKTFWQRFWIVFAGPLFNVILSFALFFAIFSSPGEVQILGISKPTDNLVAWCPEVRPGNIVKSINGKEFTGLDDMNSWGWHIEQLSYFNKSENKVEHCNFTPVEIQKFIPELLDSVHHTSPLFLKDGQTYFLSIKDTYDAHLSFEEIKHYISVNKETINLYLFSEDKKLVETLSLMPGEILLQKLSASSFYQKNLLIQQVMPNSIAAVAGFLKNDILIGLGEQKILEFNDFKLNLQQFKTADSIKVAILRGANQINLVIDNRKNKLKEGPLLLGIMSSAEYMKPQFQKRNAFPVGESLQRAFFQTWSGIKTITLGLINLFKTSNALEMVGGPITIAKAASDSWNHSLEYFLRLMALISLNLAIINLFPLPILDGGHIVFLVIEAVMRRRVPLKMLEWSYRIGFAMILFLLMTALYNDFKSIF